MSNDKMHEEFESWWGKQKSISPYIKGEMRTAWVASRAAIEIELPKMIYWGSSESMEGYDTEEIVRAIESAGLKVKP